MQELSRVLLAGFALPLDCANSGSQGRAMKQLVPALFISALVATACTSDKQSATKQPDKKPTAEQPANTPPTARQPVEPVATTSKIANGPTQLILKTDADTFKITPVLHGTLVIEYADKVLWLDPWSKRDLQDFPRADAVLVTDIHGDHLDEKAIAQVASDSTAIVAPQAVADKLKEREVKHVLANGQTATVHGIEITAVPMYNNKRGPKEGTLFHDKGRGNGYLLRAGGKTLYFAGDTACTEDMAKLRDIDHAFVPMNLPYTMPPSEAAECVKKFRPKVVTPYHYRGSDLNEFTSALKDVDDVTVQLAEFYPK